MKINVIKR
jgi:hypothetical protein